MRRPFNLSVSLVFLAVVGLLFTVPGCNKERKSQPKEEAAEGSGEPSGAGGYGEPGIISRVEKREGSQPTSSVLAGGDGGGSRPGESWVFEAGEGLGMFLLAGASKPDRPGGDVLRRIDLDGGITEHDFNEHLDGKQGLHIQVPEAMRGDWKPRDFGSDGVFIGSVCGLIPGPKRRVIALAAYGAFVLDPYAKGPAVTPESVIVFPHAFNTCKGVYSKKWDRLFAIEISRTESRGGQQGIYVVELPVEGVVEARRFAPPEGYGFNTYSSNLFDDIDLYNDVLYLIESGARFDANYDTGIHRVPLNELGEPLFADGVQVRAENPVERAQGCTLNPDNTAAGKIVIVAGKPILLSGGTQGVAGWDISTETPTRIDMDPKRPGNQPLDLEPFGQGMPEIQFAIDGKHAFGLTHCRSRAAKEKIGGDYNSVNTIRLVDFDLSGESVAANPDDAVDVGFVAFQKELAQRLEPKYLPKFTMSLRDLAVGSKHAVVVGAGSSGASGLGAASDVIVIDLAKRRPIAFNEPTDARKAHEGVYGLKLAQGDKDFKGKEQSVRAAIWVP